MFVALEPENCIPLGMKGGLKGNYPFRRKFQIKYLTCLNRKFNFCNWNQVEYIKAFYSSFNSNLVTLLTVLVCIGFYWMHISNTSNSDRSLQRVSKNSLDFLSSELIQIKYYTSLVKYSCHMRLWPTNLFRHK